MDRLTVVNGDWGATSLRAVHAVLEPAADILCEAFGKDPDAPILLNPGRGPPMVAWDRRPYWMRLSARDTYWCQYVYQFSHELCHVLVNFDRMRGERHRRGRHKWFEETLCELASLFVLHRITERFQRHPPADILDARGYAPHFRAYADQIAKRVPAVSSDELPTWLRENLPALEEHHADRELNRPVAVAMLPMFLDDETLWRDCGSLNTWDASSDPSFADYLDSWTARLTRDGRAARTSQLVRCLFA